ncbi:hypothetical protein ACFW3E_35550, partial [Streptomyces sp. NPDC058861]
PVSWPARRSASVTKPWAGSSAPGWRGSARGSGARGGGGRGGRESPPAPGGAARAPPHGRALTPDDLRAEPRLRPLLAGAGWRLVEYVDEDARYLALAVRED